MQMIIRMFAAAIVAVGATGARAGVDSAARGLAAQALSLAKKATRAYAGPTISCVGDSLCQAGSLSNPPSAPYFSARYSTGTQSNNILGWLQALSGNAFVLDPAAFGYPGSPGGIRNVYVLTTGSCTPSANLTFTPSAPTGTPANPAGAITVPIDAAGHAPVGKFIAEATPGSGYVGQPTWTVSGGTCSAPPTFAYVLTGTGNFGVAGDKTEGVLARIPEICSSPPDFLANIVGTNDIAAGVAEATIVANMAAITSAEQACGIRPVWVGIPPRNQGGWTAAMDKTRLRVNRYLQTLAQQSRASANNQPPVLYVDFDHFWADPSQSGATIGNPLTVMTYDGLHESPQGAFWGGLALANVLRPYAAPIIYQPNSQSDVYDAANNPTGALNGTRGLMLGTGGAVDVCAGSVAAGWSITHSGTGTVACSSSIETSRTDGLPGRRQVIAYSNTVGGASENLSFGDFNNFASSLALGTDQIFAVANIDVSNLANVEYIGCQLLETATPTQQDAKALLSGNFGAAYPLPTSAQIALTQEAKILPDFGLTAAGSFKLQCRTPAIKTQAAATAYSLQVTFVGNSSGGATFSFTAKISDVAIRKAAP